MFTAIMGTRGHWLTLCMGEDGSVLEHWSRYDEVECKRGEPPHDIDCLYARPLRCGSYLRHFAAGHLFFSNAAAQLGLGLHRRHVIELNYEQSADLGDIRTELASSGFEVPWL